MNRFIIEENAAQSNKSPEPELNEDGTFFDTEYQEAHELTNEEMVAELEESF